MATALRREAAVRERTDRHGLERQLRRTVRGEVRFDAAARGLYASTGSNYRRVPLGVVFPRDADDIVAAVAACRKYGAPLLPRGGGTSLGGQSVNVAVVLDLSKHMDRRIEIDAERRLARVEPGVILDALRSRAEQHGLTFAPDPSTHAYCTLGGMIGNNACGVHSVMGGRTADNVEALEVLTYDGLRLRVGRTSDEAIGRLTAAGGRRGEIYARLKRLRDRYADEIRARFPKLPRRVSGYNLDELLPERGFNVARALVGSEGTCVTVLEAVLRLVPSPRHRALLVLGYPDVYTAADDVPRVLEARPIGLEGVDERLRRDIEKSGIHADTSLLPEGGGWLLVEFGGDSPDEVEARARALLDGSKGHGNGQPARLVTDPGEQKQLWKLRESGLGATAHVPGVPLTWEGWEDSAVPPDRLGEYLRDLRALLDRFGYVGDLYGHFGDGCVHTRIDFDFSTDEGVRRFRSFVEHAADLVVRYGGSLSGEHGDGQARGELLPRLFGPTLMEAFREFRSIWDPAWKMNPGKVVDAAPLDSGLRLASFAPEEPRTHFSYADDDRSFVRASLRCVGVGECRKLDSGTMCPSYMATREEMHSTRGRARLLFEMLQGEVIKGGWGDKHVHEALDLCLACKGCRRECPVQVDMATYKAEFLARYYEQHTRPLHAYVFGLISPWARLGSIAPGLANLALRLAPSGRLMKWLLDVAPERHLPELARRPFTSTFRGGAGPAHAAVDRGPVLLWPDTFNNYFRPETAHAAADVLTHLGFQVMLPPRGLCCGRPLYDYGMLHRACGWLEDIVAALASHIDAGTPIVVLEPSCASVFRDELLNLLPDDDRARRLSKQVLLFGELVEKHAADAGFPSLGRRALVHGHCHQKALMSMEPDLRLLRRLGVEPTLVDSGCCGMAGAFGYERSHYDVSVRCAERVLLPAVREADEDTWVVSDGFSCREQIQQLAGRRTWHLAELAREALGRGCRGDAYLAPTGEGRNGAVATALAVGLIAAAASLGAWRLLQRRRPESRRRLSATAITEDPTGDAIPATSPM